MHVRISDYKLETYEFVAATKNNKKITAKLRQVNTSFSNQKQYEYLLFDDIGYSIMSSLNILSFSIKTVTDIAKARVQLIAYIENRYLCSKIEIQKVPSANVYLYSSALLEKDDYLYNLSSAIDRPSLAISKASFDKLMQLEEHADSKEEPFTEDYMRSKAFTAITRNGKNITCTLERTGDVLNLNCYNYILKDEFSYKLNSSGDLIERHIFSKKDVDTYIEELKAFISKYSLIRKLEISINAENTVSYYYAAKLSNAVNVSSQYWLDQDLVEISEENANEFIKHLRGVE